MPPFPDPRTALAATRPTRVHLAVLPGGSARDLLTTLAALSAGRDPRLAVTAAAPPDWSHDHDEHLRAVQQQVAGAPRATGAPGTPPPCLLDAEAFAALPADLEAGPGEPLVLIQPGTVPPRGWIEALLGHGREPGVTAVAASSRPLPAAGSPAEALVAWQHEDRLAHRAWYRVHEDCITLEAPLLVLLDAAAHREELGAWRRGGPGARLRLDPHGRLLRAKDVVVLRTARVEPLRVWLRDPSIEPDRPTADLEDALAQLRRLRDPLDEAHPEAALYYARVALGAARCVDAAEAARVCLGVWPDSEEAQLLLARALAGQGLVEPARRVLDRLETRGPLDHAVRGGLFASLGNVWLRLGEPERASPCIDEALALVPRHPTALYGRARIELAAGAFPAALAHLEQACTAAPLWPDIWFDLGRTRILLGQQAAGRSALERTLELAPDHAAARGLLERTAHPPA